MRTYKDKDELKNEIRQSFEKYISEFDTIPEALKDKRVPGVDRTPAENLAYQVGWTTLLLKWEADEKRGMDVKTPSEQFKWNQLGSMYQWFTDTYAHSSLAELKGKLNENIAAIQILVASSAHLLMCGWNNSSSLMESIMAWIAEIFSFNLPFNSAKDKWA